MRKMSVTHRVADHRRRMRARGYRQVQIWVPDVRTAEFAAEAHRQSIAVNHDSASEEQDFIESVAAPWDE